MRICLFGDASSVHLRRWAVDVAARGCQVAVLSVGAAPPISGVSVHCVASGPAVLRRLISATLQRPPVQVDGAGPITEYAPTVTVSNGATIVATDAPATEAGQTTGTFTVRRTGNSAEPLTVFHAVAGTATPGSDYATLPGSVTIPAGGCRQTSPSRRWQTY